MVEGASGRAAGGQLEEKVDLSAETDAKLAQAEQLVASGQLSDALALLGALEKRCRVGNDNTSLARVCEGAVQLCHIAGDNEALINTLQSFTTRRSQKTSAIRALVRTTMPYCMNEPYEPLQGVSDVAFRNQLVEALRDITDGKLFLEKERAQLTRVLATIKEQEGNVGAAADILQEVHVETYGSLSKKEKVEFILEQMRLTLAKKDYVRAAIVAGKINRKTLSEENMEEYKVNFFSLMTIYHRHDKDAFELAKDYHSIYSTPYILQNEDKWKAALQSTVVFLALSPYGNEQQDMLNRISIDPKLEELPAYQATVKLLLKKEIIQYPMAQQEELESIETFVESGMAAHWHEAFHRRIIQHNIRIVSTYYKRIQGARLAQLLQLTPDRLETEISSMVSDGFVYAKIDRPNDIVRFSQPQTAESVLSDWSSDITKLLNLVETTTHLIHKEQMMQT